MPLTDPDRLFPVDPDTRHLARDLYDAVKTLPIISPHGHCDPRWFAENTRFPNPAELFVIPDHYVFRMLASQGVPLGDLGVPRIDGGEVESDPRRIWQRFADNYYLFRGTPSAMWLDHSFEHVFGLMDFVAALKPMLDLVGMEPGLTVILFTLDETNYGRELAPLALGRPGGSSTASKASGVSARPPPKPAGSTTPPVSTTTPARSVRSLRGTTSRGARIAHILRH